MNGYLDAEAIRERHRSLNDEVLQRIATSCDDAYAAEVRSLAREELAERGIALPIAPATPLPRESAKAESAPSGMEKVKWLGYIGILLLFIDLTLIGKGAGLATRIKFGHFLDCLGSWSLTCSPRYFHSIGKWSESGSLFTFGGLAYVTHLSIGLAFRLSLRTMLAWWAALVAVCTANLVLLFT